MTGQANRRVLAATCQVHPGPAGFTNLVVTRESGRVVFEPHVDGSCVFSLDEATGPDGRPHMVSTTAPAGLVSYAVRAAAAEQLAGGAGS